MDALQFATTLAQYAPGLAFAIAIFFAYERLVGKLAELIANNTKAMQEMADVGRQNCGEIAALREQVDRLREQRR